MGRDSRHSSKLEVDAVGGIIPARRHTEEPGHAPPRFHNHSRRHCYRIFAASPGAAEGDAGHRLSSTAARPAQTSVRSRLSVKGLPKVASSSAPMRRSSSVGRTATTTGCRRWRPTSLAAKSTSSRPRTSRRPWPQSGPPR